MSRLFGKQTKPSVIISYYLQVRFNMYRSINFYQSNVTIVTRFVKTCIVIFSNLKIHKPVSYRNDKIDLELVGFIELLLLYHHIP